jgi:predicted ribosomally synthesized peptide with SipW-like signal peptide
MRGIRAKVVPLFSPRGLLAMAFVVGLLAPQTGGGTLAYFTSSKTSSANEFIAGTLDVTGSTLSTAAFSWLGSPTGRGGTNCDTKLTSANNINTQAMTPGDYCVVPITLSNTGTVDGWMRFRFVRSTASDAGVTDALVNTQKFYMASYDTQAHRDTDCTAANYTPSVAGSAATITPGTGGTSLSALTNSGLVIGSGGLGLTAGTGGAPTEGNMNATTKYYNVLGGDNASDPATDTNPHGSTAEATFTAGTSKYYCAAIFFPSNTTVASANLINGTGDNTAQGGDVTYYFVATLAQKAGRP